MKHAVCFETMHDELQYKHISKKVGTFKKKGKEIQMPHIPEASYDFTKTSKSRGSDENTKRGREEQTMHLPLGVCKSVNKGFL